MLLLLLAACGGGDANGDVRLDTSALWIGAEGRYHTFRLQDAGAADGALDTASAGGEPLLWLWETGGCVDGSGWRVQMRVGAEWADADGWGALHFSDAGDGLAICGVEEAGGALSPLDPAITLWTSEPRYAGEALASGDWQVGAVVEQDLATYFGVFPEAVAFSIQGEGGRPAGWVIHFAAEVGPVLVEGPDFTADVMYFR